MEEDAENFGEEEGEAPEEDIYKHKGEHVYQTPAPLDFAKNLN